jgi:hypothetical protein
MKIARLLHSNCEGGTPRCQKKHSSLPLFDMNMTCLSSKLWHHSCLLHHLCKFGPKSASPVSSRHMCLESAQPMLPMLAQCDMREWQAVGWQAVAGLQPFQRRCLFARFRAHGAFELRGQSSHQPGWQTSLSHAGGTHHKSQKRVRANCSRLFRWAQGESDVSSCAQFRLAAPSRRGIPGSS